MSMPEPIVAALVRGMAAFMQTARPTDLPVVLRSLRGKHLKMLTARKNDIVSSLDDAGLRALLVEWLEDKPNGISKADALILTIAARRDDGWEQELEGKAPSPVKKAVSRDVGAALEREKERTRKAKEEARRAKEQAAREVVAEQEVTGSLRREVGRLERRVAALEAAVAESDKQRDAARSELDREVRKARRRAEKAEDDLKAAKAQIRELRAQVSAAGPTRSPARKPRGPQAAPPEVPEPQRRRKLPVPKGRFEDDPKTLTEWLSTPEVHLLVDGYNVSKAEGGFGDLTLETQRDRLVQEVGKVARRHKIKATVIFDGSDVGPGTSRRARGPVEVEYSRADEIADDHLIAKLEGLPKHPVVVATNDRELQGRAARLGATIATSNQLLALIR
jgi:predicted RNA-binding protein with PIN domain